MGHDRLVAGIAIRVIATDHARDGVAAGVRQVDARIPEPDAGIGSGAHHRGSRVEVVRFRVGGPEPSAQQPERLGCPEVADGVRAVVGRAVGGGHGTRSGVERHRGIRLERVAQHVHAARRGDLRVHRHRQPRVEDREPWPDHRVADAGLELEGEDVEHAHRGRFGPSARRRGDRDQGLECVHGRAAQADRPVQVVGQVAGVGRQQVHDLGGIDDRAAPDGHEAIEASLGPDPGDCLLRGGIGGLDRNALETDDLDACARQRGIGTTGDAGRDDAGVGHQCHTTESQLRRVEPGLVDGADTEHDGWSDPREHRLVHSRTVRHRSSAVPVVRTSRRIPAGPMPRRGAAARAADEPAADEPAGDAQGRGLLRSGIAQGRAATSADVGGR